MAVLAFFMFNDEIQYTYISRAGRNEEEIRGHQNPVKHSAPGDARDVSFGILPPGVG